MSITSFCQQMAPYAEQEASLTGLDCRLFLLQWVLESASGTSTIAQNDHNYAGISNSSGQGCSCCDDGYSICPSPQDFVALYHQIITNGDYAGVLGTAGQSLQAQVTALGNSPWAGSHYGSPPGTNLWNLYLSNQSAFNGACSASAPAPQPVPVATCGACLPGWTCVAQTCYPPGVPGGLLGVSPPSSVGAGVLGFVLLGGGAVMAAWAIRRNVRLATPHPAD